MKWQLNKYKLEESNGKCKEYSTTFNDMLFIAYKSVMDNKSYVLTSTTHKRLDYPKSNNDAFEIEVSEIVYGFKNLSKAAEGMYKRAEKYKRVLQAC
jgi:hypothetical protein